MPPTNLHSGSGRQQGQNREPDLQQLSTRWARVEDFLNDFARALNRVEPFHAPGMAGRTTGRNALIDVSGPAVFLELNSPERKIGVVTGGEQSIPLAGGRQRLLVVERRTSGLLCRIVRLTELGIEATDFPIPLPKGSADRLRLEQALGNALGESLMAKPVDATWERELLQLALAIELSLALVRAGRKVLLEARNQAQRGSWHFHQAIEYIRTHYAEDLHLQVVATKLGLSARHFARVLEQNSGSGFMEHLFMTRLMASHRQLTNGTENIEGIARLTGFGSRDHFIRVFRQYFGSSPLKYRKLWRAAAEESAQWKAVMDMPRRQEVDWLPAGSLGRSPDEEDGKFHTLVIANASSQLRVLHQVTSDGTMIPEGALQPGQMIFFHRVILGGFWKLSNDHAVSTSCFRTQGGRAFALVTV